MRYVAEVTSSAMSKPGLFSGDADIQGASQIVQSFQYHSLPICALRPPGD